MTSPVSIRPLQVEDALISYKWRNCTRIWKHTGSRPDKIITPEIETAWLSDVLQRTDEKRFAIIDEQTGQYIGNIFFTNIKDGAAYLHIFIGELEFWGKGRAIEASRQIIAYGFDVLMLDAIYGEIDPNNRASLAMAKTIGFLQTDNLLHHESNAHFVKMVYKKEMYSRG